LVEFASAVDAVTCAMAVQEKMAERVSAGQQIAFRIGINVGDIIIDGDDIFGDGVNIAARVENECEPGGVCLSGSAFEQVRSKTRFAFDDLGEQSLKNIDRPVRLYAARSVASRTASARVPDESRKPLQVSDKPSIAVLPFQNMSGDQEQEYFADGLVEDIITELSRFHEFAVIARNSTFFYKGKLLDVSQVARDLKVRYVLEGSVRKVGKRVRVTAQLIDALTNEHIWAERYDREQADVFDLQEEVTHTVVASIAPQINLAEVVHSRRETRNLNARQLAWRAEGLFQDAALNAGNGELMQKTITACEDAIAADPDSLVPYNVLGFAHFICHLYRWGDRPEAALDRAWSVCERMTTIDSQNERTLELRGCIRFHRGEHDGGLADLRRACEINPNYTPALIVLAFVEAKAGMAQEAVSHARLALRLSPRDYRIGTAHLALAMAHFTLQDYAEAMGWCESAIQVSHRAPIRRALMIACSARAGDMARALSEIAVLNSFAPNFIASLFRGQNPVFTRKEDMESLLDGLRVAGLSE
jgi:adenylate cyclase